MRLMQMSDSDQAPNNFGMTDRLGNGDHIDQPRVPEPTTKVIEYKIVAQCARCGYKDSLYNKHEYTKGVVQERSMMWRCQKCDKDNIFHYTVGKEQTVV